MYQGVGYRPERERTRREGRERYAFCRGRSTGAMTLSSSCDRLYKDMHENAPALESAMRGFLWARAHPQKPMSRIPSYVQPMTMVNRMGLRPGNTGSVQPIPVDSRQILLRQIERCIEMFGVVVPLVQ